MIGLENQYLVFFFEWPLKTGFTVCEYENQKDFLISQEGAQWLSGRVLDSRPRGRGFEPGRRHCVVVIEQDTFILA